MSFMQSFMLLGSVFFSAFSLGHLFCWFLLFLLRCIMVNFLLNRMFGMTVFLLFTQHYLIGYFGFLMGGNIFSMFSSVFFLWSLALLFIFWGVKFMGESSVPSIIGLIFLINLNKFSVPVLITSEGCSYIYLPYKDYPFSVRLLDCILFLCCPSAPVSQLHEKSFLVYLITNISFSYVSHHIEYTG